MANARLNGVSICVRHATISCNDDYWSRVAMSLCRMHAEFMNFGSDRSRVYLCRPADLPRKGTIDVVP